MVEPCAKLRLLGGNLFRIHALRSASGNLSRVLPGNRLATVHNLLLLSPQVVVRQHGHQPRQYLTVFGHEISPDTPTQLPRHLDHLIPLLSRRVDVFLRPSGTLQVCDSVWWYRQSSHHATATIRLMPPIHHRVGQDDGITA